MLELSFAVESAHPLRDAASPTLEFGLRVTSAAREQAIHAILLRCQILMETPRRKYRPEEKELLSDLFGTPERWGQTLRPMLWTNINATLPSFQGECLTSLQVPCTFDLNVSVTKYFYALADGEVPLTFLFSGTTFYEQPGFGLQIGPVSWNADARFRLPVQTWKELMHRYYGDSAWLNVSRRAFDALYAFKLREGISSLEEAFDRVVRSATDCEKANA